jgi:hypothetical protein
VGVVLAMELASRAAIGSFQDSIAEISGRTNVSILGTNGIDEEQLPRIASLLGPDTKLSPVIESSAVVASSREVVSVLGIDILEDSPFLHCESVRRASAILFCCRGPLRSSSGSLPRAGSRWDLPPRAVVNDHQAD